jgi:hypothetical protein
MILLVSIPVDRPVKFRPVLLNALELLETADIGAPSEGC